MSIIQDETFVRWGLENFQLCHNNFLELRCTRCNKIVVRMFNYQENPTLEDLATHAQKHWHQCEQ